MVLPLACMQVLENSFAHDRSAIDNPQGWVQNWAKLVTAITANSVAASRTIISPLGNPDAHGLQWVSLQHGKILCFAHMAVLLSCINFQHFSRLTQHATSEICHLQHEGPRVSVSYARLIYTDASRL